jgi:hypothetical protein
LSPGLRIAIVAGAIVFALALLALAIWNGDFGGGTEIETGTTPLTDTQPSP